MHCVVYGSKFVSMGGLVWVAVNSGRGFTFSGAGFVLLTVNVTIIVLNFVLVAKPSSSRAIFRTSVFDIEEVGITPIIYFLNFVFVVCNIVHGPGAGRWGEVR